MENAQIAAIFDEIADLLELQRGNAFRIRSYRGAAQTVRDHPRRMADLVEQGEDLTRLPHVGESTADKIQEILRTGSCQRLEALRKDIPSGLTELMRIQQVGPRTAMQLYQELGVKSVPELERACVEHRVRELEGMGEKTEHNILEGLRTLKAAAGRISLKQAADQAEALGRYLESIEAIRRFQVAGSFRRCKETVGDLDVLVEASDREQASEGILEYAPIDEVMERGDEKLGVRLQGGLQIDFRFFDAAAFGAALLYFTGSKAHNIAVRRIAVERGWKLNEYGLFKGKRRLAGKTEEAIYRRLGFAWVPPELREDRGELEAAARDALPELVTAGDIRGDLHAHTQRTDGAHSLEQMAEGARERGYQYLAITEHSKSITMAKGLDGRAARRHAGRIRELDEKLDDLWLLAGIEVDILASGKLDLSERVLEDLDWVVASVHSRFDQSKERMTRRLIHAIESGVVHCLGHPMTRILGRREPIEVDADRIFEACAEQGVALEIDAQPERLDLPDIYCQRAREAGVRFVISTDAHKREDFDFMSLGVATARRGWLTKKDVLNTRTARGFRRVLGREQA